MNNSIDIKDLWNKQTVPVVNQFDVIKKIKNFRRKRIRKTIILNTIMLLTIFLVVFIWIYFNPQFISTKIGIILTLLPITIVILFNVKVVSLYKRLDESLSNFDYLNNLLAIKSKEDFMQTKIMYLYFILLSSGISLYMFEYTLYRSLVFGIIAYLALFLWIGVNWFFLRPRIIKKNKQKIDYLLEQIHQIR